MAEEVYKFLPQVPLDGPKQAEDLITKDLLRLSFNDRNAIHEEIHGVKNSFPEETPELLQLSIRALAIELARIQDKPAFDRSQELFPHDTYVNTANFRLKFLRCELFDAKKAAARMVAYLEILDDLFEGNFFLQRPIRITDLSKAEMKLLRLGIWQLLPYRDRSGRPIYMELGSIGFMMDLRMRCRIRMYIFSVASNDTESQRKGLVSILWPEGNFTNIPMPFHKESRRLMKAVMDGIPIRRPVTHFCMPDNIYWQLLRSFWISFVSERMRARTQFHIATGVERRYSLQGFGIPVDTIPITDSGNIKKTYLYQWIKVRKMIEAAEDDDSMILLPRSNDVLIRTGTTTLSHPGNMFFRGLIEMKHYEFRAGSDFTQAVLAEDIVEEIEGLNGRFLSWDSRGYWTELLDRDQILFKVEVSIRDFKGKIKARKQVQTNDSSTNHFKQQDGSRRKRKKALSDCTGNSKHSGSGGDSDGSGSCCL